jgi:Carboxypeptidase regulatory-like domain
VNTRAFLQLTVLVALSLVVSLPLAAQEDKKAEAQLRTLHGSVVDKDETPVASSVVYLLNVRTQAVKTYIADDAGVYRFSGLDPNVDYEIHAEHDELQSATRTLSSFDSRKDIEVVLKLSHKKTGR